MKAFHWKCTSLIIFNINTSCFLAGVLSVCNSLQFFTFSSFVIMQFSLHWVRATSWWDYCGYFFPWWGLNAASGKRKKLWVLAYLPRIVWKLKHIYEIIKNYFENCNFLFWILDYLSLLSGSCPTWANHAQGEPWSILPSWGKISIGKTILFSFRSLLLNALSDCIQFL